VLKLRAANHLATIAQRLETGAEAAKIPVANAQSVALGKTALAAQGAAAKMTLLARAQGFLGAPLLLGGRNFQVPMAMRQAFGGRAIGGMAGAQGGARTMGLMTTGGAALGAGLGVVAGVSASNNMEAAGYKKGEAYMYGAATGIGAAGAAMFLPGGAVAVAIAEAAAFGINELYSKPLEAAAKKGSGFSDKEASELQGLSNTQKADKYNELAERARQEGDDVSAQSYMTHALSLRKIEHRKSQYGTEEWRAEQSRRASELAANPELQRLNKPRPGAGAITNSVNVRGVETGRNNTRTVRAEVVMSLPEDSGQRSARALRYSTLTPSPAY
jgi:hypothetical protein